ncbi:MAG TPA: hypothetical protein VEG33_21350, partial [Streptosporangiaceae bacterium]|nr:hypothetical protein [Streptosporangiaceae bacterium]
DAAGMSGNFLHHRGGATRGTATVPRAGQEPAESPGAYVIDWRAVQGADHACCCPARPVVIAIMPPGAGRPHQTELLLCGHHYRVSRKALGTAGATVLDIRGAPITGSGRAPARMGA